MATGNPLIKKIRKRIISFGAKFYPAPAVGTANLKNREQWLEKTLQKIPNGKKILDAGAGELQYKKFCNHLKYVSQDFAQYTGEGDAGLQTNTWDNSKLDIISDITAIPVKGNSFGAIMCIEVFEHLPDPIAALREFSRILCPGGTLVVTVPVSSLTHFAPFYFYNGFSRYFFEKFLKEEGFDLMELTYNGNYFEYLVQEILRIEYVAHRYIKQVPKLGIMDEFAVQKILNRLEKLSDVGEKSTDLLSFGLQVVAKKNALKRDKNR